MKDVVWIGRALAVWMVVCVAASTAFAETPSGNDWSGVDVKGQAFDTRDFRGKVLLVFANSPALKGQMLPLTEKLILKYGHDKRLGQVTLVDLSDAPLTWHAAEKVAGTVTERLVEVHDWNVQYIQNLLKTHKKPAIRGLTRKMHIIMDWDGAKIARYKTWDTSTTITVIVIDPKGNVVGAWPGSKMDRAMQAVEAILEE